MPAFRRLALATLMAACFSHAALCLGQANNNNNNNNNNNGLANAPAGVFVSPEGVFRFKQIHDPTGDLTRTRIAESRTRLPVEMAKASPLRKISLQRLEAALAERLAAGKDPSEEMRVLAGLTRLQYVFYYPDTKDIVLAGPAEGYFMDFAGRYIGIKSGRAVIELQDLVAALRAFPPSGDATSVIAVSIDPTQEGLARRNQYLSKARPNPNNVTPFVEGLREQDGLHNVTITGVSPKTHFAQVLVEADYRMKLIGIGLEPPPMRMAIYVEKASSNESLQRWFFTPNYECVRVAGDELAMELVGQGVKLVGEGELVDERGQRRAAAGQSKASSLFCQSFTHNYPQIAVKNPVYGQLKNMIDLAIAAAFMKRQDYHAQAGWHMETFGDERKFAIERYEAPRTVEPAVNAIQKGNRLMTPIAGGVQMEPLQAIKPENLIQDEDGTVKKAHEGIKLDQLAKGQWWWD